MSALRFLSSLALCLALAPPAQASQEAFPPSTALAEEVSPESLARLGQLVQSFVDDEEIVGAELLVIKNGRSILHEGFGLKDQEQEVAMGTDNVFCVRSMTKPLIGTSILMLVGDKQLRLSDPVSKHLPEFDNEEHSSITIEQLLTHTSGMSMSRIMAMDLTTLEGIQEVARLGAKDKLEFAPGTGFNYSDQGTDTLTAIVEVVSGMPAAEFVRTRVLEPLGMADTTCVMTEGHPLRERGCCKYNGSRGSWSRFWGPEDKPLFPFFLGSQGLYSTLEDYGRFMEFWLNKGRSREERLLRGSYVRKALTPNPFPFPGATGMPNVKGDYGFLMQLWMGEAEPEKEGEPGKPELVAFGHTGSDGTHAWVFPEHQAIVLYFTQSRGTTTGWRVEEALGELFLGATFDPNMAAPPFEQYLGYYAEDDQNRYQAVIRDGEDLALETPGKRLRQLIYVGEDRWKFRDRPGVIIAFDRADGGDVTGFHIGDHEEFRFEPAADLPELSEVVERIKQTHRLDLLETLGPLRTQGTLRIEKLDITGEVTGLLAWPDKMRADSTVMGNFEKVAYDGQRVWHTTSAKELGEMEGPGASAVREGITFAALGDWNAWHTKLEVIQRIQQGEHDVVIVRAGDTSSTATTFFVDWKTGRLGRMDRIAFVEGMGRIGLQAQFGDYRDVSGILLPFKTQVRLSNSMIGTVVTTIDAYELGVELPEGTFSLTD